ncbi:MAG: helix-turn-helix domain-containing protein [Lachnospiraceae bacterium]|nr:helix-turn-helix domain-containing protein [Lachnospiraceae bacterium]MBQ9643121.1 helix-turn-helix domain-containing protein [Lachnospiraceae bacterium]
MAAQEKPRGREALSGTSNLDERIYATMTDTDGRIQIESHAFRAGNFRFNWNEALDLTMVLKGRLKLCTEDGVFELGEDDFALINSNVGHAGLQEEFGTVVLVVLLSPSYVERLCGFMPRFGRCASFQSGGQAGDPVPEEILGKIRQDMASLYRDLSEGEPDSAARLIAHAHVCRMMGFLIRWFGGEGHSGKESVQTEQQRRRCRMLTRYVDQQFRNDLKLTDMAAAFKMNSSYLSDYFQRYIGLSFHEYLTRKRLEYGVFMLNNTEHTVLEIAMDAGFPNVRSFQSAFGKFLGMSPGAYRKEISRRGRINLGSSSVLTFDDPEVREKIDSLYDQ